MSSHFLREDRALESYFREIEGLPTPSAEEERELLVRAKKGDREALAKLVYGHLRFVVGIAKRYKNMGVPLADLINEGNLGLIDAVNHFDLNRKVRFLSYAVWWIRQRIISTLNHYATSVRVNPEHRAKLRKIQEATERFLQDTGYDPTTEEVARELGLTPEEVERARQMVARDVSLDAPVSPDSEGTTLSDIIEQTALPPPDEFYEEEELQEIVNRALSTLEERERKILTQYFGIGIENPMTLEQIGRKLGISRERVRQIKDRAIEKLREKFGDILRDYVE